MIGGAREVDRADDVELHGRSASESSEVVQSEVVDLHHAREVLGVAKAVLSDLEDARRSEWTRRAEAVDAALGAWRQPYSGGPARSRSCGRLRANRPAVKPRSGLHR